METAMAVTPTELLLARKRVNAALRGREINDVLMDMMVVVEADGGFLEDIVMVCYYDLHGADKPQPSEVVIPA